MTGWDRPLSTQQLANAQQQNSILSIVKEHLLNNLNTAPTAPSWEISKVSFQAAVVTTDNF